MIAHGKNGSVSFDGYFVHISRRSHFNTFLNQGVQGDRSILLRSITAIEFLDPRGVYASGFIRFDFPGKNPPRGGVFDALADENAVVFMPEQTDIFLSLRNLIMQALAVANPAPLVPPTQATYHTDYSAAQAPVLNGPAAPEPLPQAAQSPPVPLAPSPSDRWGQERLK